MAQSQPRVEHYRRLPAGGWEYHEIRHGSAQLQCGATLELDRLYSDLPH